MNRPENLRRHRRIPGRVPITLAGPQGDSVYLTENLSAGGVFVRTDTPRPLRRLVQFRFTPPGSQEQEIQMLAMVVYVVTPEQSARLGKPPGMGLNLYGLDEHTRRRWEDFVHEAERRVNALGAPTQDTHLPTPQVERIRRQFPRSEVELRVQVQTPQQLRLLYTHNISLGGAFLRCDEDFAEGARVKLIFSHPADDVEHTLHAIVARTIHHPPEHRGFAVYFEDMSAEQRRAFHDFVDAYTPPTLDEVDEDPIVEQDDPWLL
jgi:hypothetical protein